MGKSFLIHSLFLISAVVLTWFWTNNPGLSLYNLQFIAIFILFYFLSHFLSKSAPLTSMIDAIIFTIIILLLVASTGGLGSPLFFLVYFLLFAVSLLFEPQITLTLTATLMIFFLNSVSGLQDLVQLFSVILILPLAIFVGRQYLKVLEANQEIKILQKGKEQLTSSLAKEETDSLLWLSLNLKNGLLTIAHLSANLLSGIGQLTLVQKENLEKIHQTAKELLKSGEKLKQKIDRETD